MSERVNTLEKYELGAILSVAKDHGIDLPSLIRALVGIDEITPDIINDAQQITTVLTVGGFSRIVVNELRLHPEIDLRYSIEALKQNTLILSYRKNTYQVSSLSKRAYMFDHLINWVGMVGKNVFDEMTKIKEYSV